MVYAASPGFQIIALIAIIFPKSDSTCEFQPILGALRTEEPSRRSDFLSEREVMTATAGRQGEVFHLVFIKPTHYDDDGYPLQWYRSTIPSNSLACLNGIATDACERKVLGDDVDVRIMAIDETNRRVRADRLIKMIKRDGGRAMIGLVGVQSNQFPRAIDLARPFLAAGIPVCLGGFHVSGSLAMLDDTPPEIVAAANMGISFFLGELEDGRFDPILRDAYAGKLKSFYDYRDQMPSLQGAPIPFLGLEEVKRTFGAYSSFDLGRGCPFQCSFCTIINVQGRVSRYRSADDLEHIVRANQAIGINRFFLTDDNLARNRNWEACFDRLIALRENEGLKVRLQVQVDALCHRTPKFIEKAVKAGVDQVFVGMENINPDSLLTVKKNQNKITEYCEMFLQWKKYPVVITVGYIIGFPNDTRESILHDVELIKRELPIDLIYFTNLTPLPGSEDHMNLVKQGAWMDPDLNKYDLNHRVTHHPRMSDAEWDQVYREVWDRYYTFEHMETILRRMFALGSKKKFTTLHSLLRYRDFYRLYDCHPLEGGLIRMKSRTDRRYGMARENPLTFYVRYGAAEIRNLCSATITFMRLKRLMKRLLSDPLRHEYRDQAIKPTDSNEFSRELYAQTRGSAEAIAKERRQKQIVYAARAS
jgi:pyruvate-formate lyase-activating enzyme